MAKTHPVIARLRKERVARGLSLEKFGEAVGYSGNHIYSIETGKIRAKIDIVEDLAQALGMTIKLEKKDV